MVILECNGFAILTFRDNPSLSPPGRAFMAITPPKPGLLFTTKPGDDLEELPAKESIG